MRSLLNRYNPHLFLALAMALVYHGALLLSGSFKRTYDAYVHIFFADHYARMWFDHWDPRWYTGFTLTSYPPGSQQSVALLSFAIGLPNGFAVVQTFAVLNVTIGIYRFSKIWVSEEAAGYAALLVVFASSIAETVHVFGQLPTMFSLGFLLNALVYVRRWIDEGDVKWLFTAWLANAATTAGHHVTTLFGAVFFVAPVIAASIVEAFRRPLPDEPPQRPAWVTRKNIRPLVVRRLRRIIPHLLRATIYGPGLIGALVLVVLPYWLWSRSDPITQVSIPHASRDSFILNPNAGLVFWLIPYGVSLIMFPYAFYKGLSTRAWPMTLSLGMLFFLGTGGTTPFPKMLLRGAFDVLTLDRFTFWATITVLPLLGEFVVSIRHGRLAKYLREQFGDITWRLVQVGLVLAYLVFSIITANFTHFRKFQPAAIDMQPIVTFLEKDQHWRWRYLTLGFGDQMAWLSAQTMSNTVDGNYHSARRLPELTTTPVERLEGAKYSGVPGIGSLQQFLAVPDKYNLKFVFSNDQFYDPLLYFSGWHRLQRLENGIVVWEREDIPPLPEVLPRKEIPIYQRIMWGVVPLTALALAIIAMTAPIWGPYFLWLISPVKSRSAVAPGGQTRPLFPIFSPFSSTAALLIERARSKAMALWLALDRRMLAWSYLPLDDDSPAAPWQVWVEWIKRLPRPKPAPPTAHHIRLALLSLICFAGLGYGTFWYIRQARTPVAIVEAYYDDLDFRRFSQAYARLDPVTRPTYDQYLLELSVKGGLVASYGKLNSISVSILTSEPNRVVARIETVWVTALAKYPSSQDLTLVLRDGYWYIVPNPVDVTIPPDQFIRRSGIRWHGQGRRRITAGTTSFGDILDRPELQILSARLVRSQGRYSVVGELINTDVDPSDVTVTALLYNERGETLTWYNAQAGMIHKLFPKEVTPFRVDFEGVAGTLLTDTLNLDEVGADAYTPILLPWPVSRFEVYGKAVITEHDLSRDVTAQNIRTEIGPDGKARLVGQLLNSGTEEATIPHVLVTYYDQQNRVVWVDHVFIEEAIRPQRAQSFAMPITPYTEIESLIDQGDLFANVLSDEVSYNARWRERIVLPPELGYASLRISIHSYTGGGQ